MADHSILPDKITGWNQRQMITKLRQFQLVFMNPIVDMVSKTLTSFGNNQVYRVVYMGPRHNSNMKAYKAYCANTKDSKNSQSHIYGLKQMMKFSFKHFHETQKFFPIRVSQYRLFTGMNPTFKKDDLKFDSDFQCGNLDLAVYVNPAQYDLIMRVDSNTRGHTAWFYFKVTNCATNQKIKFNIINFGKKNLLYKDGMKPYVYKKSVGKWCQSCTNITYNRRKLRYEGLQQANYQCLSFIYEFKDSQQVYFAYCIPYSYSFLLNNLEQMRAKYPHLIKISYDNESTGGLPIPLVQISNFITSIEKTKILCTGRLHPGQTQGSWMIDGFMRQLLRPQSFYLREKAIFTIIPMVNVDGVVLGNFRTGIMGRDLNRCFHLPQAFNQINFIHRIAQNFSPSIYIDFHGHSAKKNVFIYGPNYKLQQKNYLLCRIFPKLISKQTQAFRYYSCSFMISKSKQTTGRAVMIKTFKAQFSYTVQASSHGYGPAKNQILFSSQQYQNVGMKIAVALMEFIKILRILPKREQLKPKQGQQNKIKSNQNTEQQNLGINQNYKSNLLNLNSSNLSILQNNLLKQIMKDEQENSEKQSKKQKQQESEDSDFEDESNDYSNSQINKIMECKFQPSPSPQKQKQKNIKKKIKKEKTKIEQPQTYKSNKSIQISIDLKRKQKPFQKKSFSIKTIQRQQSALLNNSGTIQIIQKTIDKQSFEEKASKLLQRNPHFMNQILLKNESKKKKNGSRQFFDQDQASCRNNVKYNWSSKKQQELRAKNFQFQIPQFMQPLIVAQKPKQQMSPENLKKQQLKKNPLLSIKKSTLPTLGRSIQAYRQTNDKEKSMLSSILQEHQKKKKANKNFKIMFL